MHTGRKQSLYVALVNRRMCVCVSLQYAGSGTPGLLDGPALSAQIVTGVNAALAVNTQNGDVRICTTPCHSVRRCQANLAIAAYVPHAHRSIGYTQLCAVLYF